MNKNIKPRKWGWLVLFASTSTLLCCALPILLVSIGMGAVVASLASNFPFLVALSLHKGWVFSGSALILFLGGLALYKPGRTCPTDPKLGKLCNNARKWNLRLYWGAALVWFIGFFTAFLLLPMTELFGFQGLILIFSVLYCLNELQTIYAILRINVDSIVHTIRMGFDILVSIVDTLSVDS